MTEPATAGALRQMTHMRRYILWSMYGVPIFILVFAWIDLFVHDYHVLRTVLYAALQVAVLLQRVRLASRALDDAPGRWPPAELVGTFLLSFAMYLDMTARSELAGYWVAAPALVLGLLSSLIDGGLRRLLLYGGPVLLTVAGVVVDYATDGPSDTGTLALVALLFSAVLIATDACSVWWWRILLELDEARSTAGALAVTEERLRIAADLHDIQGNHLQAIALKGELAERLIGQDDDAARQQAAEIAELARTALSDTRALVQGYRKTSLDIEINNAVGLLDAAGIEVTVRGAVADVPARLRPLFGAVFREGTTNLLRHSNASTVRLCIEVAEDRVTASIANDGVDSSVTGSQDSSGLAGLRERFTAVGGRVQANTRDGEFELTASVATNGGAR